MLISSVRIYVRRLYPLINHYDCFTLLLSPILDSVTSVAESRKRPNQSTSDSSESKQFKEDDSTHGMFLLCTNYCSSISDSSVLYIWCIYL